ncbi:MAG: hypothetical protein HY064_14380 [Bacteroidetes bacterium]|nr:hypothetical protein [Bacteroidota bacterium]
MARTFTEQQLQILNYEPNFIGLSKSANASKGSQTFLEWMQHKSSGIYVEETFRAEMIIREQQLEIEIQRMIDNFLK